MTPPTRPLLRWHGGKWREAPWIIRHFPAHDVYVEPFGGAGSVLIRKKPSYAEIYNDLDGEVVNLFRILRDQHSAARLVELVKLTPFSRLEFNQAYQPADDEMERARRLLIRSFQGFGSDGATGEYRTGFRANSNRSGTTPAHDWAHYPEALAIIVERMRGVVIECRPAIDVMQAHDRDEALHYVDPPYMMETRSRTNRRPGGGGNYRHELSEADHAELLEAVDRQRGMVVLSGYATALYDDRLRHWHRTTRKTYADGARERVEVLWINGAARERLGHGPLFAAA